MWCRSFKVSFSHLLTRFYSQGFQFLFGSVRFSPRPFSVTTVRPRKTENPAMLDMVFYASLYIFLWSTTPRQCIVYLSQVEWRLFCCFFVKAINKLNQIPVFEVGDISWQPDSFVNCKQPVAVTFHFRFLFRSLLDDGVVVVIFAVLFSCFFFQRDFRVTFNSNATFGILTFIANDVGRFKVDFCQQQLVAVNNEDNIVFKVFHLNSK